METNSSGERSFSTWQTHGFPERQQWPELPGYSIIGQELNSVLRKSTVQKLVVWPQNSHNGQSVTAKLARQDGRETRAWSAKFSHSSPGKAKVRFLQQATKLARGRGAGDLTVQVTPPPLSCRCSVFVTSLLKHGYFWSLFSWGQNFHVFQGISNLPKMW